MTSFLLCAGAYLLGSIPFGLLLGKLAGVDIREHGSGNIGATNLARSAGRIWGVAAFLGDFFKGFVPTLAAKLLASAHPENLAMSDGGWVALLVGLAALLGHVFPVYLRFRGGKGVATTFGVLAALAWLPTAMTAGVWVLVYCVSRFVSLASICAAVAFPLAVLLLRAHVAPNYASVQTLTVFVAVLIVYRHRSNITRLLRGEEFRIQKDKTHPSSSDS